MCLTKWMSEKHGAWTFLWTTPGSHEASYSPSILSDGWKSMIPHDTTWYHCHCQAWHCSCSPRTWMMKTVIKLCCAAGTKSYFAMCPYTLQCTPRCFSYSSMMFHIDVHVLSQPFLICPPSFLFCSCFHHDCPAAFWGFPAPGRWSSARGSDSRAIRRRNLWASAIG